FRRDTGLRKQFFMDAIVRGWTPPTNVLTPVNPDGTATPAAIALTAEVPTPTATGQINISTTPAAITRTVVTPAPIVTGGTSGRARPQSLLLGRYNVWSTTVGGSNFSLSETLPLGQSFTGDGSRLVSISMFPSLAAFPVLSGTFVVKVFAHSGTFGTSSVGTGAAL